MDRKYLHLYILIAERNKIKTEIYAHENSNKTMESFIVVVVGVVVRMRTDK